VSWSLSCGRASAGRPSRPRRTRSRGWPRVPEVTRVQVGHTDRSGGGAERGAGGPDPSWMAAADAGEDQVVRLLVLDVCSMCARCARRRGSAGSAPRARWCVFVGPQTSPWPWTGVTDSTITARLRRRSSRATRSAAISPNRTPV
jgi:hypothetical protein